MIQTKLKENEFLIKELKLSYQDLVDFRRNYVDDDFIAFLQIPEQVDYCITFHYQVFTIRTYYCQFIFLELYEEEEIIYIATDKISDHYLHSVTESEFSSKDFESLVVKVIGRKADSVVKIDFHLLYK